MSNSKIQNGLIFLALAALAVLVWAGQQRLPDPYMADIQARGVLRVGIDPSYPPFEVVRDGKIEGYDADLARALASDLGLRVEFVPLALDTQYDALAADKVDVLVSALPFVYERQKEVRYSVPYYQAGQVLVVRAGDGSVASVRDLAGRRVAVELGSNADTEARRLQRTTLLTMDLRSVYHAPQDAMDALIGGDVDAAIADNASALAYVGAKRGALSIVQPPVTDEPYVVAMPARAGALAEAVNATIERLRASGELSRMMGEK
jgi:ABC-type amino acid transport substrate-binding protein